MQGAKSAISNLLYGSSVCTSDNHSLRACVDKKKKALVGQGISEKKIFENVTVRTHADSSTIL